MTDTQAIESVLQQARTAPSESLPQFLGKLEEARVTALARLSAPAPVPTQDELLDITQACALLHCSKAFLYHRSKSLPFARRAGRKLLFSRRGIEAYLTKKP
ncbi:MAG: helix-turn-helix domain-containing protein [Acidobacteriia bacterium]|nr:helix-turn-helix domain-containing protein [Terriglobia bacterium]